MNILYLAQEFYALEAVVAMLASNQSGTFDGIRHSHSRWHNDFFDFRNEYIGKFASAIYDYTVSVVAGELRHCEKQASHFISGYYNTDDSRDAVYKECSSFRPGDVLCAGMRMFDTSRVKWNSSYGGDKWLQIAKAGLMKGKVNDCVFIDHCVDLSHNNSVYFDKGAGIFFLGCRSHYREFLDLKQSCKPEILISTKRGVRVDRLLMRANNLGIINIRAAGESDHIYRSETETSLFNYRPITWGTESLDFSEERIIPKFCFSPDSERNYNRYDDREYKRCA